MYTASYVGLINSLSIMIHVKIFFVAWALGHPIAIASFKIPFKIMFPMMC